LKQHLAFAWSVALEILHFAFALLGGLTGLESAEIAALSGLGVFLARIEPTFGFYMAYRFAA
jgi:hypothetical protein